MKPTFIFMGTPDFGVPSLEYLIEKNFPVLAVVTQPDRARGRGHKTSYSPVKEVALKHNIPVMQPENVNTLEFLNQLKTLKPDILVVAAFGQILKQDSLNCPPMGCINLHGSLLPKYRGAAPIQWALANGEQETGITVQHMAKRVDSGAIIIQEKITIGPDTTAPDLFEQMAALGGPTLEKAMLLLAEKGRSYGIPQIESEATFAPRLSREDGKIDWSKSAKVIHDQVRAFNPWPGTVTEVNGEILKILKTVSTDETISTDTKSGTIVEADDRKGWLVATGNQTSLRVLDVQCANSKKMAAQAFTCGYRVGVGDCLGKKENN